MRQKKLYVLSLSLIAASAANSLFGMDDGSVDAKAISGLQAQIDTLKASLDLLNTRAINSDGAKTVTEEVIKTRDDLAKTKKLAKRTMWALAKAQVVKAGANLIIDDYIAPLIPFHRLSGRDQHIATMETTRRKFQDTIHYKKQQLKTLSIFDVQALEEQFEKIETMQNSGVADYTERGVVAPWYVSVARSKKAETIEKHLLTGITKIVGITFLDGLQNFAVARWNGESGNGYAPKNKHIKSSVETFAETVWLLRDELSDGSSGAAGSSDIWGEHRDTHKFEMAIMAYKISRIRKSVEKRMQTSSSTSSAAATAPGA